MFKKLSLLLTSLVALTLAFGTTSAWAAGPNAPALDPQQPPTEKATAKGTVWGAGVVTAIASDNFTVHLRSGAERVVYVDSNSQFTDADASPIAFAALQVGDRVLGAANKHADGKFYAVLVHVFPGPTAYKGLGHVTSVDAAEESFEFTARRNNRSWEFYVDADTVYTDRNGGTHSFAEIAAEQVLFVQAEKRADGKWWAVRIGFPLNADSKETVKP